MFNWHALFTKPHCERQVEEALEARGIPTFLPLVRARAPRAGRPDRRPFFPCYLFAYVDLDTVEVSSLNWMPGVRNLVMFGGRPAPVDERIIAGIRGYLAQPETRGGLGEGIQAGDRVVKTSGLQQELEAIFDKRLSGVERAQVLVRLLERSGTNGVGMDPLRKDQHADIARERGFK